MPSTYDPRLATDLDWVRLQIGDQDATRAILSDEEVAAVLAASANKWYAAATCGALILARSHGVIEKQVGDLRLRWPDGSAEDNYRRHLADLRVEGSRQLARQIGQPHGLGVLAST